jgi:uncharacterized membrane protein
MSRGESPDWVAIALEEYRTLRQESLAAMEQMQRTLQGGVVAIGVLTGFGVEAGAEPATQIGLVAGAAIFAGLVMVMWLDELQRSVRAGAHVAGLEARIAAQVERPSPLTWETSIQARFDPDRGYRYRREWATTAALYAAALPATVLGVYRLGDEGEGLLLAIAVAIVVASVLTVYAYQRRVHKTVGRLHHEALAASATGPAATAKDEPAARS